MATCKCYITALIYTLTNMRLGTVTYTISFVIYTFTSWLLIQNRLLFDIDRLTLIATGKYQSDQACC